MVRITPWEQPQVSGTYNHHVSFNHILNGTILQVEVHDYMISKTRTMRGVQGEVWIAAKNKTTELLTNEKGFERFFSGAKYCPVMLGLVHKPLQDPYETTRIPWKVDVFIVVHMFPSLPQRGNIDPVCHRVAANYPNTCFCWSNSTRFDADIEWSWGFLC